MFHRNKSVKLIFRWKMKRFNFVCQSSNEKTCFSSFLLIDWIVYSFTQWHKMSNADQSSSKINFISVKISPVTNYDLWHKLSNVDYTMMIESASEMDRFIRTNEKLTANKNRQASNSITDEFWNCNFLFLDVHRVHWCTRTIFTFYQFAMDSCNNERKRRLWPRGDWCDIIYWSLQ